MRIAGYRFLIPFSVLSSLVGCVQHYDQVILLPQANGQKSAVVVAAGATPTQILDKPFQVARRIDGVHPTLRVFEGNEQEIRDDLGPLMRIAPTPPIRAVLYFQNGGVTLAPSSVQDLELVVNEIKTRSGAEFFVVGHTDTVGAAPANDALSLLRANSIAAVLIGKGVPSSRIEVVGRGEREPLVPTPDEVDEPRNRRVEILVY